MFGTPVLAVCGYSGSGKTTLLESVVSTLVQRGLAVAVVKHDAHGFSVDREGKDSDRFFRAGAAVALRGSEEQFLRRGKNTLLSLEDVIAGFALDHDLILVEGHKNTPLPKVWMASRGELSPPGSITEVKACLPWDSDRISAFLSFLESWMQETWMRRPMYIGVEKNPFSMHKWEEVFPPFNLPTYGLGVSCEQRPMTLIPLAPDFSGPMAGILTAHRWAPYATWLVTSGELCAREVEQLSGLRRPGVWSILPSQSAAGEEGKWQIYEPQALEFLARAWQTSETKDFDSSVLRRHPKTILCGC